MQRYYNRIIQINKFAHQQAFKLNHVTNKFYNLNRKISNSNESFVEHTTNNKFKSELKNIFKMYMNISTYIWFLIPMYGVYYYQKKGYPKEEIVSQIATLSAITFPFWSFITIPYRLVSDSRMRVESIENKINNR